MIGSAVTQVLTVNATITAIAKNSSAFTVDSATAQNIDQALTNGAKAGLGLAASSTVVSTNMFVNSTSNQVFS